MAASQRDPFRHPRQQDIPVTPRRDTTAHSLARDIRPDRVTLRRDTARSLAQDLRPDRVTPRRDMARSLALDIRPDRVTPRRDMARSLARDIRPDRVTPRRDMARSLARDIRPDRVTTVARADPPSRRPKAHTRAPQAISRMQARRCQRGTFVRRKAGCHRSVTRRVHTRGMIPVRPVELALLEVLTETNAGVETALDALARVVATTLAEGGDYAAARRFYKLLEAALLREG